MREPLSHPGVIPPAVKCPAAFSVSIPGIAHFNNVIEEYRPCISHPHAAPRPGAFSAPSPRTALLNNITEKYRSPLYRRLMGGESHA